MVDVGAGTTDVSLFWVVQRGAQFHRAWPIKRANAGIRQAGDTLDRLLVAERCYGRSVSVWTRLGRACAEVCAARAYGG